MNTNWLLRMARLAQRPPSKKRLIFFLSIFGICFLIFTIEYFIGWPDALSMDTRLRRMRP